MGMSGQQLRKCLDEAFYSAQGKVSVVEMQNMRDQIERLLHDFRKSTQSAETKLAEAAKAGEDCQKEVLALKSRVKDLEVQLEAAAHAP